VRKQRRHLCIQSGVWSAIVLLITVACAAAQPATGHGVAYELKSEVTFEGIVQQVAQATGKQALMGIHLMVDSGGTITDVYIGPQSLLASSGITFAPGDPVKVTGAMAAFKDSSLLLARTITRGNQTLVVRDAHGLPLQSPGRRGSGVANAKSSGGF
jgi:DNA/RNA endonuclease YhcR with UshA esterase domain